MKHAKVAAFGMTRRRDVAAEDDQGMKALVSAGTPAVTVVGKSWDLHVREVLSVSLDENLRMIGDSGRLLRPPRVGSEVVYDAEHFFDGLKHNPDYTLADNSSSRGGRRRGLDRFVRHQWRCVAR